MRWPWSRGRDSEPATAAPVPAPLPVVRGEWRALPPIQRTIAAHPLVNPVQRFTGTLSSWRDPSYLAPLGHLVGPAEPAGVADLARPVSDAPSAELPVATPPSTGRRGASSTSGSIVFQRLADAASATAEPVADAGGAEPEPVRLEPTGEAQADPAPTAPGVAWPPTPATTVAPIAVQRVQAVQPGPVPSDPAGSSSVLSGPDQSAAALPVIGSRSVQREVDVELAPLAGGRELRPAGQPGPVRDEASEPVPTVHPDPVTRLGEPVMVPPSEAARSEHVASGHTAPEPGTSGRAASAPAVAVAVQRMPAAPVAGSVPPAPLGGLTTAPPVPLPRLTLPAVSEPMPAVPQHESEHFGSDASRTTLGADSEAPTPAPPTPVEQAGLVGEIDQPVPGAATFSSGPGVVQRSLDTALPGVTLPDAVLPGPTSPGPTSPGPTSPGPTSPGPTPARLGSVGPDLVAGLPVRQDAAVQRSGVQPPMVQRDAVQRDAVQHQAVQHEAVHRDVVQHAVVQRDVAQRDAGRPTVGGLPQARRLGLGAPIEPVQRVSSIPPVPMVKAAEPSATEPPAAGPATSEPTASEPTAIEPSLAALPVAGPDAVTVAPTLALQRHSPELSVAPAPPRDVAVAGAPFVRGTALPERLPVADREPFGAALPVPMLVSRLVGERPIAASLTAGTADAAIEPARPAATANGHAHRTDPAPAVSSQPFVQRQVIPAVPVGLPLIMPAAPAPSPAALPAVVPAQVPVVVQRVESETAPPMAESPAPGPAPAATAAPGGGQPEELLARLYDPLLRRLKADLRLDRERRGVLTDQLH